MDASPLNARARRALTLAAALVAALGFSGPAAADLYLGFGSGRASLDDRILGEPEEFNGEATSEHYFLGVRLGHHASLEIGRADLGLMSDEMTELGLTSTTTVRTDGRTISLLFAEPIAGDLSVFLRAGVFDWAREGNEGGGAFLSNASGQNGHFGLGASLRVSDHLVLRAEYQRFEVGDSDYDVPTLALIYRF
jgi:opacity protein-like surface antigen